MSHFTVLVIGPDPEKQLEPFDEQTEDDQYIEFESECTEEELRKEYDTKVDDGKPVKENYASFEEYVEEWHGYKKDPETGDWGYYRNPMSKWDWYKLGGRWTGYYPIKEDADVTDGSIRVGTPGLMTEPAEHPYADAAPKGLIDFDRLRQEAIIDANKTYDRLELITRDEPLPELTWVKCRDELFKDDIEKAREVFNNQGWVKLVARDKKLGWGMGDPVEDYCVFTGGREAYVKKMADASCVTFAVLKDGQWYESGDMGWWGMVSDKKDENDWNKEWWKLIDSLPDDTLLSLYDCHI